jgi:hypothetical protein
MNELQPEHHKGHEQHPGMNDGKSSAMQRFAQYQLATTKRWCIVVPYSLAHWESSQDWR